MSRCLRDPPFDIGQRVRWIGGDEAQDCVTGAVLYRRGAEGVVFNVWPGFEAEGCSMVQLDDVQGTHFIWNSNLVYSMWEAL